MAMPVQNITEKLCDYHFHSQNLFVNLRFYWIIKTTFCFKCVNFYCITKQIIYKYVTDFSLFEFNYLYCHNNQLLSRNPYC